MIIGVVLEQGITSFTCLCEVLDARAKPCRTTMMWTDNLIKTIIIIMAFSHPGYEGEWVVHLLAAEAML